VSRTRATYRSAEFGFFGVDVYTRVHTPRFCGQLLSAGLDVFQRGGLRPLRTSWLKVGTNFLSWQNSRSRLGNSARPRHRIHQRGATRRTPNRFKIKVRENQVATARIMLQTGP